MTTAVRERPILFSGPMVRAILDGRKTQTRRVVTVPWHKGTRCVPYEPHWTVADGKLMHEDEYGDWNEHPPPYGQPGDRLWVRETWYCDYFGVAMRPIPKGDDIPPEDLVVMRAEMYYRADGEAEHLKTEPGGFWRPSIHMPRWASRLSLDVVGVRVERLQEISMENALAEGSMLAWGEIPGMEGQKQRARLIEKYTGDPTVGGNARDWFAWSWSEIYGARGHGWDANPFVWVVEFRRCA